MATYTPNYNLSKPEATDTQSSFISDYCDNMDKIDQNLGDGGNVDDVEVNGVSVLNPITKVAEITSYKEVTQAEYDALPATKLTDGVAYFIKDSGGSGGDSVAWTQIQQSGTKIAEIEINGVTTDVYAPQGAPPFSALIIVTADTGKTVTATKGGDTYTATEVSTGQYEVSVDSVGTWTISDGTLSDTVTVTSQTTYYVTLSAIPDGSTVLPTDDVQILLNCADIWDKAYTTIAQLLADTTSLMTVISDNNAIDYLVRSTTFASSVTADSSAMTYIGLNNYASNTLLADSTWCNAICNSTYFESVLNVKVPTMTSNTTPEGECIASGVSAGAIWKAFRNTYTTSDDGNYWQSEANNSHVWIGYVFENPVTIKTYLQRRTYATAHTRDIYTVHVQSSSDGITWNDISDLINVDNSSANAKTSANFASNTMPCRFYRIYEESGVTAGKILTQVQFYGRKDV